MLGACTAVVGCGLEGLAKPLSSPELLIIGRFLKIKYSIGTSEKIYRRRFVVGVAAGLNCGIVPLYLTEMAPVELRGAAGTAHQIAIGFGDWFGFFLSLPEVSCTGFMGGRCSLRRIDD